MLPGNNTLKGKRQIIKGIKDKIKNRFNVSISEVDGHDLWQKSSLGICMVGVDNKYINSCLDNIINFLEELNVVEIIDHNLEIINL